MSSTGLGGDYRALADYYTPQDLADASLLVFLRELEAIGEDAADLNWADMHGGGGAWLRGMYKAGFTRDGSNLEVSDLDASCTALQIPGDHTSSAATDSGDLVETGFLVTEPKTRPDGIVGNPPFGVPRPCPKCTPPGDHRGPGCKHCKGKGTKGVVELATRHVVRAIEVSKRHVLYVLRLGFLGSRKRSSLWLQVHLRQLWVLIPRVPFSQVCRPCAGTGAGLIAGDCEACRGSGKNGKSGTDSAEYGLYWFDKEHNGPWGGSHLIWRE